MRLHSYFRSSAAYRVRIALALKGLQADYVAVHLLKNEQMADAYRLLAPAQLVPTLEIDDADADGAALTQSIAIIEYLDETHAEPPLLPPDPLGRARVRAIALDIACEIHPLDNLRVLRYLVGEMKVGEADKDRWYRHWVETGLAALEQSLRSPATGRYCHGDTPSLADCVLVPQIHNAQRMACATEHAPTVMRIFASCMQLDAFAATAPARCPDAA